MRGILASARFNRQPTFCPTHKPEHRALGLADRHFRQRYHQTLTGRKLGQDEKAQSIAAVAVRDAVASGPVPWRNASLSGVIDLQLRLARTPFLAH
jgi:hypothetical protein